MMTQRKTLTVLDPAEQTDLQALQKKGRGWKISDKRLDALHERAREMRRHPTPAQEALAAALAVLDTGGFAFRRQDVIGSAIVDFACKPLMMVIELDGDEDASFAATRDRSLTEVGYRVERVAAADVLADPDVAAAQIVAIMRERWHERRDRAKPHNGPRRRPQE
jgi:very-short-patch-repair endonuclease